MNFVRYTKWSLFLAACFAPAGLIALADAKEQSVVADKKVIQDGDPAIEAPILTPPANEQTLPPPSNPAIQPAPNKEQSAAAKQPFLRPAAPKRRVPVTTALAITEEEVPAPEVFEPVVSEVEVKPTPPIEYDTDRDARRLYRSSGEVELVMVTQNPADGCFYEIPLCIPACCVGEPTVSSGRGIFGRGVVEYCWPSSGFRAVVKFRQIVRCDVKVEYEGD